MAGFNTRLVHQPRQNDNQTGAVAVPVYKATTFAYPKIGAQVKCDYSRSGNPTRNAVEEQLASLEGGDRAFFLPAEWRRFTRLWQFLQLGTISSSVTKFMGAPSGSSTSTSKTGAWNLRQLTPGIWRQWKKPSSRIPRQSTLSRLLIRFCR